MSIDFALIGSRIREVRNLRGLTADTLSERVGLAAESLRHIETGASKPSLQTLFKIAEELNVSLDYLTGRTPSLQEEVVGDYGKTPGLSKDQEAMLRDMLDSIVPIIADYV